MLKLLSIGNSFSQDAHKWLKAVCSSLNFEVCLYNLFIGGCSLEQHWNNIDHNAEQYVLEINGEPQEKVCITDIVKKQQWDIITLQQASHFSGLPQTYEPYLEKIAVYLKQMQPQAKLYLHETWAYEVNSTHAGFANYQNNQEVMFRSLQSAYQIAAQAIGAKLIPVGDTVQYFRNHVCEFNYQNGGLSLNRDGFHLSYLYGRYLAACVWAEVLFGLNVEQCPFVPKTETETANKELIECIQKNVHCFLKGCKGVENKALQQL